jgi:uridine kinase
MIGDKLIYHSTYKQITNLVMSELKDILNKENRICISVGGESGCGKTSLTYALLKDIEETTNLRGFIFHADDYFISPPKDNHNNRLEDISNVGIHEVKLKLLDSHIDDFMKGKTVLKKPLVIYDENVILEEHVNCLDYDFCLVEGTYAMLLEKPNYKVFMEINYQDTRALRIQRARDIIDDFAEQVLDIEHQIVKKHKQLANISMDKKFNITNLKK